MRNAGIINSREYYSSDSPFIYYIALYRAIYNPFIRLPCRQNNCWTICPWWRGWNVDNGGIVGQFGVNIDPNVKTIFFALFIYAVGYQGGGQFFRSLNFKSINLIISAVVMALSGLLCVLAAAWFFDLDRGTAAGLAAGGLTQSAIVGTAGDAIGRLGSLTDQAIHLMQTNIAVGYAITYIFGSLGPILMVTWVIPTLMKWDIRAEAIQFSKNTSTVNEKLTLGECNPVNTLVTRAFKVNDDSTIKGMKLDNIGDPSIDVCIELIEHNGQAIERNRTTKIITGDTLIITGRQHAVYQLQDNIIGIEVAVPESVKLIEESRQLIATNSKLIGRSLQEIKELSNKGALRGIYITNFIREQNEIEINPDLIIRKNDTIEFTGSAADINRVERNIGQYLDSSNKSNFAIFGMGMVLGLLIGLINFNVAGVPVTIGPGVGCLISGLFVGWLGSRNPYYASLPMSTSTAIRDIGIAVFVAIVGLEAGPQAIDVIKDHGLKLLFLGAGVTIIPQLTSFFFSYYVLKIKNPIEALGCLSGGRNASPALAALLDKTGNATPLPAFTVTYAVANILLALCGPIIVAIITLNVAM